MGIFKKLFGESKPIDPDQTLSQAFFRQAFDALRNDDFKLCMDCLANANTACKSQEERVYFFGLMRSRPGSPVGVAGMADYSILSKHDIDMTFMLLDFIEDNVGSEISLCEVWFSLYQEAIEKRCFDKAKLAYARCLNSQRKQWNEEWGEKYFRINRQLLKSRAYELAEKHNDDKPWFDEIIHFIATLR